MKQRFTLTLRLALAALFLCALQSLRAQDGTLDASFGTNGKVWHPQANYNNAAYPRILVLPDGKILHLSTTGTGTRFTRYLPDGAVDAAFGSGGSIDIPAASGLRTIRDAALLEDGRFLVSGGTTLNGANAFGVARYNANGTPDATFDGDGRAAVPVPGAGEALSLALQSNGHILLTGNAGEGGDPVFATARLTPNGTLDNTFGGDGIVTTNFNPGFEISTAVIAQPDGKIVVAGTVTSPVLVLGRYEDELHAGVVRYLPDGTLDAGFDGDGKSSITTGSYQESVAAVSVQPDGKIVIGGSVHVKNDPTATSLFAQRYTASGASDAGFAGSGYAFKSVSFEVTGTDLGIQTDGKILVAGFERCVSTFCPNVNSGGLTVVRFLPDGTSDPSFGNNGRFTMEYVDGGSGALSSSEYGNAIASQGSKLLLGANAQYNSETRAFLMRLNNSAPLILEDPRLYYEDLDGDGYGSQNSSIGYVPPAGYVTRGGDCNDFSAAIHPGAPDVADGIDNNCNTLIDEDAITYISIPARIEAEAYAKMSGVQNETTRDSGGGLNVGYIDYGDWMEYNIRAPRSGYYTARFRLATPNSNAQFRVMMGNTVLATVNVPNTGGFQTWQTHTVPIFFLSGNQTIRILSTGGSYWNINWMQFEDEAPANTAPTANAGADQAITLPANTVTLNGSGTDADGTITGYSWTQVSGPAMASFGNAAAASTTAGNLQQGVYTFRLTVTDNGGSTATDDVVVTVNPSPNRAPSANAGTDITITQPANSTQLNGSGTDADGSITGYSWNQVAGPNTAAFSSTSVANPTVSNLVQGTYTFRLTVTDNNGATASDEVMVTVQPGSVDPAYVTIPAKIEAERYTAMYGVQNESTQDAGGGQNVGYIDYGDWMEYKINVPAAGTYNVHFRVATPNSNAQFQVRSGSFTLATVNVVRTGGFQTWQTQTISVPLAAGQHTIRLQSTGGAYWNINWLEFTQGSASNVAPVADAGPDRQTYLPQYGVQLTGSGSDAEGAITGYRWSQVSGPAPATFNRTDAAVIQVSELRLGSYVFRLTVTDLMGATGSDDVVVNVYQGSASPGDYVTIPAKIEAERQNAASTGVYQDNTTDAGGGQMMKEIKQGDFLGYRINVPSGAQHTRYAVRFRVATPNNDVRFELRNATGGVLAQVSVPNTGGYQTWQTVTAYATLQPGLQTVYVVSTGSGLWNFNWLEFALDGTTTFAKAGQDATVGLPAGESAVSIFPNPVRANFTLKVDNGLKGQLNVQVAGANGAVLQTYALNKAAAGAQSYNLVLQGLPKGVYTLQVQMKGWKKAQTLIKQ